MPGIPKTLHFIWVGHKPIPDKYVDNIKKWIELNPDFKVNLWVDSAGTPEEIIEEYKIKGEYFRAQVADEKLALRDANALGMINVQARHELDRLIPNYGAASDLIRYHILISEGGGYLDCDVRPPAKPLSEDNMFWDEASPEPLYMVKHSESMLPNDMLFCSPCNALLTELLDVSARRYRFEASEKEDLTWEPLTYRYMRNYKQSAREFFTNVTIARTGPCALKWADDSITATGKIGLVSLVEDEVKYRTPLLDTSSDMAWIRVKPLPCDSLEAVLAKIEKEVMFEGSEDGCGILQLEDICINAINALVHVGLDRAVIIHAIIQKLAAMDLSGFKEVELSFFDEQITDFYFDSGLIERCCLLPCKDDLKENQTARILQDWLSRGEEFGADPNALRVNFVDKAIKLYEWYVYTANPSSDAMNLARENLLHLKQGLRTARSFPTVEAAAAPKRFDDVIKQVVLKLREKLPDDHVFFSIPGVREQLQQLSMLIYDCSDAAEIYDVLLMAKGELPEGEMFSLAASNIDSALDYIKSIYGSVDLLEDNALSLEAMIEHIGDIELGLDKEARLGMGGAEYK